MKWAEKFRNNFQEGHLNLGAQLKTRKIIQEDNQFSFQNSPLLKNKSTEFSAEVVN
jgi:hypothetical protein